MTQEDVASLRWTDEEVSDCSSGDAGQLCCIYLFTFNTITNIDTAASFILEDTSGVHTK